MALAVPAPEVKLEPAVRGLAVAAVVVGVDQVEASRVAIVDLRLVAAVEKHPAAAEGMGPAEPVATVRAARERAAASILMLAVAQVVTAVQMMVQQRTASSAQAAELAAVAAAVWVGKPV
jgi:hypothetical protein